MLAFAGSLNKFIWHAGLYAGSAAALRIFGFVLVLWLARVLPVEDYASFGLLYAVQTGIATFVIAGIYETVVGRLKDNPSIALRDRLFSRANAAFALMSLPVSALALLVSVVFTELDRRSAVALVGALLVGVISAFSTLQSQIVRLEERHVASLCFSFIVPFAGLCGGALGFLGAGTLSAFFAGSAIGLLIALFGLRAAHIGSYHISIDRDDLVLTFSRLMPFLVIAVFGWLSGYGNNYVVKALFNAVEVAKFTFALTMTSIMQLIATALNQVWGPQFYKRVHQLLPEVLEKRNRQFYRLQGFALGLIGAAAVASFPMLMKMLGGNLVAYESMSLELSLLFCAYVALSPWWHCHNYYLAHGKGEELMRIVLTTSALGIAIWITLMWVIGPAGIYIGFLVQMLLRSAGIVFGARKRWPVRVAWEGVLVGMLIIFVGYAVSVSFRCSASRLELLCAAS